MRKIFALLALGAIAMSTSQAVFAKDMLLEQTENNCMKIHGWSKGSTEALASNFSTSMRSVKFIRSRFDNFCIVIADTPVGPHKCRVDSIISSDRGQTAFAHLVRSGEVNCRPL